MARVRGEMLGGVFLYKLEPGRGSTSTPTPAGIRRSTTSSTSACRANPAAAFVYEDERLVQRAGDVHWFRNDVDHEVVNDGDDAHVILTVCVRLDRGVRVPWSPPGWTMDGSRGGAS
jgi:hypothetical protein